MVWSDEDFGVVLLGSQGGKYGAAAGALISRFVK